MSLSALARAKGRPASAKPAPAALSKDRLRMVKIDFLHVPKYGVGLNRLLCATVSLLVDPYQ
jgi:hypothetical protein